MHLTLQICNDKGMVGVLYGEMGECHECHSLIPEPSP